jgi:hypothetical protein
VLDNAVYTEALAQACACICIEEAGCNAARILNEDWQMGMATARQRQLLFLENCLTLTKRAHTLPRLTETFSHLLAALRGRWLPEMEELPGYAPLRDHLDSRSA